MRASILLISLLAIAGCTTPRCREAQTIYDSLPYRTNGDALLVIAACM